MSAPRAAPSDNPAVPAATTPSGPTHVRYLVLAALCAAAVIAYIHRNCLAVPKSTIKDDLELTAFEMDQVLSAFYLGYALFQIPGGWLGDRWGTRLTLSAFVVLWSVATGLTALADTFVAIVILQVSVGMAQACIFPCCVKSFSKWFPLAERAFPSGLLASFMSVGGALEKSLTGFLLLYLTWQGVLGVYMIPGLLFAVWFFLWFRDRPEDHPAVNEQERSLIRGPETAPVGVPAGPAPVPWRTLATSGRLGLICSQQFFRAAAYVFYATQFPTFLQETRNVSQSDSGFLSSFALLGVVFGSLCGGLVMDYILRRTGSRWASRKGIALTGTVGGGVFLLFAYVAQDPFVTIAFITASTFCAGMTGPAGYTITIDQGGPHVATVFSIMNTAGNIGATLLPVVLGAFVRAFNWDDALLFVAALYAAAALCWALLQVEGRIVPEGPARV